MTAVTRFPHYHQAENVVTNHVMVMLRTLYNASPNLLEALLRSLCQQEVTVGPVFSQQVAGAHSVPDGLILQEPLSVFVETKLGPDMNADQLARHCQSIVKRLPEQKGSFLIGLTAGRPGKTIPAEVDAIAQQHHIKVVPATFGELIESIGQLPINDLALKEVVQEFADFIFAQGLVPREEQFVAAMLTGTTWPDNLAHGVYYEPIDRAPKHRRAAFLGLYHDKQVSHVGRIVAVVPAMRDETGAIAFEAPEMGTLGDPGRQAVRNAIAAATGYYPDLAGSMHRYYLVDGFAPTDFRKVSPGGMMGHRYLDIEAIAKKRLPTMAPGSLAAQALDGKTYE